MKQLLSTTTIRHTTAMGDSQEIERYTMQSFVGVHLSTMEISDRQREAIQKLIHLPDEKFSKLCTEITNEIHRRNGMQYVGDGVVHEKLARLSDEKFKNLVVDVLLVCNFKNPGGEELDTSEFIEHLQELINSLKEQAAKESFQDAVKNLSFVNAVDEYNKLIKSKGLLPVEITDAMNKKIKRELQNKSASFLEALSYPKYFLEKVTVEGLKEQEELRRGKRKIEKMMEDGEDGVKSELLRVIELKMSEMAIPAKQIEVLKDETEVIINALKEIENDLAGTSCVDLEKMSSEIKPALYSLIERLKRRGGSVSHITALASHKPILSELSKSATKLDAFKHILNIAKDLRNALTS